MEGNLSRRSFLRAAALGSAGLALRSAAKAQPAKLPHQPNLLVFLPDQQRADTIECYGANNRYAPNLSKLGSQSFVFEQAYITHPLCTPSRSSLLTGTWPHSNGCTDNGIKLDSQYRCLPEMIGDKDYRYAYVGKWHLGDEVTAQHGFDEWASIIHDRGRNQSRGEGSALSDYEKFLLSKNMKPDRKGKFSNRFETTLPLELSKAKFVETRACDFLDRHRDEPFVLFVAFWEPHPPYNGPLNDLHPLDEIALDPTVRNIFSEDMPLRYRLRQESAQNVFVSDRARRTKQKYLGLVTEVDQSIGAVLSKLETLGLADNTIVVHTSDHGDMMGAHRLMGKLVLFEEAVRVPYLIRMPGQRRRIQIPQQVSHIDFAPTMLDVLGKKPDPQCVGKSRAPLLRGESMAPETILVQWSPSKQRLRKKIKTKLATEEQMQAAMSESTRAALSPDGWKLCLRDKDKNELYNLRSDPREEHNVYNESAGKDAIARLTGEIHRWQESVGDNIQV